MAEKKPDELPPEANSPELDEIIEQWKEDGQNSSKPAKMLLYKYEGLTGSAYNHCGDWEGEDMPSRHEIGCMFGSGRFWCILKSADRKKKPHSETFRLNPRYDELKEDADRARKAAKLAAERKELQLYGPAVAAQPAGMTTAETFQLFRDFLRELAPIIKANQTAPAQAPDLLGTSQIMQKVLRANLLDTLNTYETIKSRFMDLPQIETTAAESAAQEQPQTAGAMILQKIIQMIEPYFSKLATDTAEGKAIGSLVNISPDFQAVIKNPTLCNQIIKLYAAKAGIDKTKTALKNIGIQSDLLDQKPEGQQ
jgi:hypothetical protein